MESKNDERYLMDMLAVIGTIVLVFIITRSQSKIRDLEELTHSLECKIEKMDKRLETHEKSINNMVVMLSVEETANAETNS